MDRVFTDKTLNYYFVFNFFKVNKLTFHYSAHHPHVIFLPGEPISVDNAPPCAARTIDRSNLQLG